MPSKLTLLLLFVSFLALFNIGLALPTDSLSLKRAPDAEPDLNGTFDLAERADKPAGSHNHTGLVECFGKIHECDFNHEARNHSVCANKFLACLPTLSSLKPRMNSTAKPKAGPVTLDGASISAGYVACSLACLDTRARCRRLTYDSRSRCDSAYIACMGMCSHLLKKRDFEDPDLQARATEFNNIEARAASIENPALKTREGDTADTPVIPVPSRSQAAYLACKHACTDTRNRCRRLTMDPVRRTRCDINYYACNSGCNAIPHKRDIDDAELQARAIEDKDIEARDFEYTELPARDVVNPSLEARVEDVAEIPAPLPSQKTAAYVACRANCLHMRTVCRRNSYTAAQRSRCGINYYACNSFCEGLPHKRDFEDVELDARDAVYDNVEAREADPEEFQEEKRFYPYPPVITPKKPITGHPPEGNVPNPPFVTREASPVVVKPKIVSGHPPEGKVPNPLTKVPRGWPTYAEYTKCVKGCNTTRASCKAKAEQKCGTKYGACTKACGRLNVRNADAAPVEEFYPWPPHKQWVDVSGEFSSVEGRDLEVVEIE